jgi:TetR/AcrR family transcriptional repressor of nem operon
MGHSKEDKKDSHERIVQAAARRFREAGIEGVGVQALMNDAGLTHGGFYRHFASREDLVAEAVERALKDGGQAAAALERRLLDAEPTDETSMLARRKALWQALVDGYLSLAHRDQLASSCAVTTLAGDVSRSNARARTAYGQQVDAYLDLLAKLIEVESDEVRRSKSIAALAILVGAVSMARAVSDAALSEEILASARRELKLLGHGA